MNRIQTRMYLFLYHIFTVLVIHARKKVLLKLLKVQIVVVRVDRAYRKGNVMAVLKVLKGNGLFDYYLGASSIQCLDKWRVKDSNFPSKMNIDGVEYNWHPALLNEFNDPDGCIGIDDVVISAFNCGDTACLIKISHYTPPDDECPVITYVISKVAYLMSDEDGQTIDTIK